MQLGRSDQVTSVVGSFGAKHRGFYFRLFQDDFGDKQLWDGLSSERSRGNAIIDIGSPATGICKNIVPYVRPSSSLSS